MFIPFLILSMIFISSAGTLQSYQQREKSFFEWKAEQAKWEVARKSAAEKQKQERMMRELQTIRRRQQFRREFRTTANLENDYLEKEELFEKNKKVDRDIFSRNHRLLLDYYDKNVLPLKTKEYDLEDPPKGKE